MARYNAESVKMAETDSTVLIAGAALVLWPLWPI